MLRQQEANKSGAYRSLSDYIAPKNSGREDYIGGFIATAGLGVEEYVEKLKAEGDDYNSIMVKVLADRLAEAFAEKLHQQVRKEYWGYAADENLTIQDMLREKYRGIRPAFGYPSLRDHSEKLKLFKLLNGEENTGVALTESFMMQPAASVCGLYFASEEAKYFDVNKISKEQAEDYAVRSKKDVKAVERSLSNIL
jgi:methionine synthase (B12-dependent) (EC 2.1.1.13)